MSRKNRASKRVQAPVLELSYANQLVDNLPLDEVQSLANKKLATREHAWFETATSTLVCYFRHNHTAFDVESKVSFSINGVAPTLKSAKVYTGTGVAVFPGPPRPVSLHPASQDGLPPTTTLNVPAGHPLHAIVGQFTAASPLFPSISHGVINRDDPSPTLFSSQWCWTRQTPPSHDRTFKEVLANLETGQCYRRGALSQPLADMHYIAVIQHLRRDGVDNVYCVFNIGIA